LDLDPDAGRYSGALALDFVGVGLSAIGVVDTRLPNDARGWAMFLSIFATFPGIPLGFGFFLSGVGGIACVNRAMDALAIAEGLKSGAANAILFPDDPLVDAPLIIGQLDAWFPIAEGSAVIGVAGRITWGVPTLVTGDVGVMLAFPDLDIAILGSLAMALPDEETALVEMHMDSLGVIDPSEATVLVTASLYDSSLLHTIQLSGDMALYARFGADPYFLLSVGGFNPHFEPPGDLPAVVTDLRRMRAEVALSEDVWYALEAYIALTSNTLQFGALAELEASAKFLLTTYTARGEVGFDVLLVFSPFAFIADFHASVDVTAGSSDNELVAVSLTARLEGPKPWFASGTAEFDFFGIDVPFHVEVGGSAPDEAPPRINVLDEVIAAFETRTAWRGVVLSGAASAGALTFVEAEADDEPELRVRPDAELEAVQNVAPLDRALDRYGAYAIDGLRDLTLTAGHIEGFGAAEWEAITGWFAPAVYDDMSATAKLASPSYEEMTAGVRIGAGGVGMPTDVQAQVRTVTTDYERRILDASTTRKLPVAGSPFHPGVGIAPRRLDPSGRAGRAVASTTFAVGAKTWRLADATTGRPRGPAMTYREALRSYASDPTARATRRLAPAHAVAP
ncbi:MAG: hypothetical protein L0206_20920, partial [Actinobacteria bacterium]|nr:hypothetical protein [Actinomycetota bacterium]